MIKLFIDASVFFSACYSEKGASFEIFRLALRGEIQLAISEYVLQETERNLARKSPQDLPRFRDFLDNLSLEVVRPSRSEVLQAARYTELKDAPIVAAARRAIADYLVSLDRRHLVDRQEVTEGSGLTILVPEEALRKIHQQSANDN